MQADLLFSILILIMSVVVHEVAHGYMANLLGDPTARLEGRLTLNPMRHLDPVGSFLVPLLSYTFGGLIIGWARPVPYNPYNLRPGRWSEAMVAGAGPAVNLAVALVFGFFLRFAAGTFSQSFLQIIAVIVFINIILAVFNLMPIPPLDGSKLLFALFPENTYGIRAFFERYGLVLLLFFVFFLWQYLSPIVVYIFRLITGVAI